MGSNGGHVLAHNFAGLVAPMAEILIKIGDQGIAADNWKNGDPICVQEDGWPWGRCESKQQWIADGNSAASWPGGFFIVKMPGTSVASVLKYAANNADAIQHRAYTLDTTGLNLSNGEITATPAQVLARLSLKAGQ